jgi:signal transduction histidine kinase/ActR/RegA family two-component response regulator
MNETGAKFSAVWTLRGLVVASIVLPVVVVIGGGWLAWRDTVREATASLQSDLAVSQEQATEVLDSHILLSGILLSGRVNDLVGSLSDEELIARERELHNRLRAMIAGFPQVTAVIVVGRSGHPLVATSRYPVDHDVSLSDREYFKVLRDSHVPFYIGGIVFGRITGADVFSVATRRGDDPNRFAGVILLGVPPSYFRNFDREMFAGGTDYSASLIRDDGTQLASYPETVRSDREPLRDQLLVDAIARMPQAGLVRGHSAIDQTDRLIAYRRLGMYPVFVTVGRRWGAIVREWRDMMASHLVFGFPATLGLFGLSVLAMRQSRRQSDTLAQLQAEVGRRELAEEALRQSQKMEAVGRLTGGIAHDFNNHLTVISSNIELLQRRLPAGSASLMRLTDAAMTGVQRAATLTHRLLAFSRQQPLEPEPLDLGQLVSNISELLRRTLGETIVIETVLSGELWLTRVDANQLENALLNLAVNARDAMPDGGNLTIETANAQLDEAYAAAHADVSAGQYVMLAVTDTGTGMTPEVVSKAFEPFFTTKPLGRGTGLGLSMVYGFVKQSGGHLAIDSDPGLGSSVKVYLPRFIREETKWAPAVHAATDTQPPARGATILVVEDDEGVRRSSVEALREMGYEVLEAGDAMDGVRLIVDRGGIDLLFTDVGLPGGVNGRALADAGRSARPGMRVLFTTGYTRNAILHNGMLDRGVHFIAKPFSLTDLAAKIREVLEAPVQEAEIEVVSHGPSAPGAGRPSTPTG